MKLDNMAYVRGAMEGDGYVDICQTNPNIQLETVSKEFANNFSNALLKIKLTPIRRTHFRKFSRLKYSWESSCYRVRATLKQKRLSEIQKYKLSSRKSKLSYLIGLYQAEGNLYIKKYPNRIFYNWRIINGSKIILRRAKRILKVFGIDSKIREYPPHVPTLETQNRKDILRLINLGVIKADFKDEK